ncbi:response regulator [Heliophilum fasciatum]|uniref:Stage 0 sporulation protein A homolog n=1 Tax=Heliophilum fasciatum TaxID=35700 RepID=A0A4R2RPU1_9FIRM|nr:response regulator [Heliophilum fasciatum]MCW2277555.1 PAS domain S-box-containing protein [Heliophilum fasciatum]TCP65154.1 PAS domain S-box-containing protein [Heliophilum fasciatum]
MRKDAANRMKKLPLFRWIWRSYFKTALIPILTIELIFIGIYFYSNEWSKQENTIVVREMADEELRRIANKEAAVIGQQTERVARLTEIYRQETRRAMDLPALLDRTDAARLAYTDDGAYYTTHGGENRSAVFYSGFYPVGAAERDKVARLLHLQPLMATLKHSEPLVAALYVNTFDSLNVIYPYFEVLDQYPKKTDITTFNFYYEADAIHNPEQKVRWTDAYLDPAGNGWMASCIAPVYNGDKLEAVVGIDMTIDTIIKGILNLNIPWNGYGMLVGKDGAILALPGSGEDDWGLQELTTHQYANAVEQNTFKPDFFNLYKRSDVAELAMQVRDADEGLLPLSMNGQKKLVSWSTVTETGWKLLVFVPEANIYEKAQTLRDALWRIGALMVGGMVLFYAVFFVVLYRQSKRVSQDISQPLVAIDEMLKRIGQGEYRQPVPNFPVTELQDTASLLAQMGERLGGVTEDLTKAQEEVAMQAAELRALVVSLEDLIIEVDGDGRLLRLWSQGDDYLIRPRDQLLEQYLHEIIGGEKGQQARRMIKLIAECSEAQTMEIFLPTLSGERWFEMRASLIHKDQGAGTRISILIRHITERKQMQDRLVQAKEEAEQASRAKSEFLSSMSHELRTPMNAILGFAQVLDTDDLSESERDHLQEIQKAGKHLLALINDVLDLSRIESGRLELQTETIDIDDVIDECLTLMQPMAQKMDVDLQKPETSMSGVWIKGDLIRVKQVLLNLISNAIKYNRVQGTVRVGCRKLDEATVAIDVMDTGLGIAQDQWELIFEPFHRSHSKQKTVEGIGVGLTVTKQLVEVMGGRIKLTSVPGQGSHFWMELPLVAKPDTDSAVQQVRPQRPEKREMVPEMVTPVTQAPTASAASPPAAQAPKVRSAASPPTGQTSKARSTASQPKGQAAKTRPGAWSQHGPVATPTPTAEQQDGSVSAQRILLVDDNKANQKLACLLLKKQGYIVDVAVNGEEALAASERETYDVILMDCQMPIMDGFEATRLIRQREAMQGGEAVTIIAMTANAMHGDREKCLQAGMNDYISKPIDPLTIKRMLEQWSVRSEG